MLKIGDKCVSLEEYTNIVSLYKVYILYGPLGGYPYHIITDDGCKTGLIKETVERMLRPASRFKAVSSGYSRSRGNR